MYAFFLNLLAIIVGLVILGVPTVLVYRAVRGDYDRLDPTRRLENDLRRSFR